MSRRRLSRPAPYVGKHRATETTAPLAPPQPAAATSARPERLLPRRRAVHAAAGLLALSGAVSHDLTPAPRVARATTVRTASRTPSRTHTIRPAAARPAPVRVPARAASRSAVQARTVRPATPATRAVEVAGAVYRGRATWYGPGFAGRRTASGEVFRPHSELTAAHRWLPFGTRLRVCRGDRCVVVRVNDRGPYGNAILDLSQLAAERLGMVQAGIVPVTATVLTTRVVRSAA